MKKKEVVSGYKEKLLPFKNNQAVELVFGDTVQPPSLEAFNSQVDEPREVCSDFMADPSSSRN